MALPDLRTLSTEEKIGQLFFIGIPGDSVDETTRRLIEKVRPGGICLFARNIKSPEQTRRLTDELRDMLDIEPFISIDQEGGLVDRLRRILGSMPSAATIRSAEDARIQAGIIADALLAFGFNMDFAPVVDVIGLQRAGFSNGLHSRAYGGTPDEVVEIAGAFLSELQSRGVIGCLKHFPGLGASEVDSHEELPTVNLSEAELDSIDLYPYRKLLAVGAVHAVMVAHAAYPGHEFQDTDSEGRLVPSSLSASVVNGLLRLRLGYDGLVLTDDLEMGAVLKNYGIAEASVMAVKAGNDMLAICAGVDSIYAASEAVNKELDAGTIDAARLDASVARILRLKSQLSRPHKLDADKIATLSRQIVELNNRLA